MTLTTPKASSTVTVTCPGSVSYTGSPLTPCSAVVTGPGGLSLTPAPTLTTTYENNINAGTATASYAFEGNANYEGSSGQATFEIVPAISTVTVSCPASVTYDGTAQTPCTATVTGAGGLNLTPVLIYTNNINAGTASASYTFAADANYAGSTGSASFTIGLAASITTVTCGPGSPYTGAAQTPCSVTVTGPGGLSLTPAPAYANNINAGTASASYTYAGDANYAGSTGSGSFTIPKAPSAVTVACTPSVTYTGQPQAPCTAQATGVGMSPVNVSASLVYTGNVNAGTAGATATYAGDANHDGSTGVGGFTIARATPVFSGLSGPTINAGATPTVLSGTIKSGTLIPSGSVSITLNGVTQSAAITATGTFSSSFATGELTPVGSPYPISYSYAGDTNFTAAGPDTSRSLTANYVFVGLKNAPPPTGTKFNSGSAVTMEWQFKSGSTAVDSSQVTHWVTMSGGGMTLTFNSDAGGSGFRYSSSSKSWQFNLQTKNPSGQKFPAGVYVITIAPQRAGYPSKTFSIELK